MNIPFRKDHHHHHDGSFDHNNPERTIGSSSYMSDSGSGLLSSSYSNASDISSSIGSYNSVNSTNSSLLSTSTAATWMGMSPPNYVVGFSNHTNNNGVICSTSPQPNGCQHHHTKSHSMNNPNHMNMNWSGHIMLPQDQSHQHGSLLSNSNHHQFGNRTSNKSIAGSSFDYSSSMEDDISLMNSPTRGGRSTASTFNSSLFGPPPSTLPVDLEIPSRSSASVVGSNSFNKMMEREERVANLDSMSLLSTHSPKVGNQHHHQHRSHHSHDDGINVNMFVRSVVGKVLSDDVEEPLSFNNVGGQQNHHSALHPHYQQSPLSNNNLNLSPQPSSPSSRRFMSMSCPTVLNSFQSSIGFQLFQQQPPPLQQHDTNHQQGTKKSSSMMIDYDLIESVIEDDDSLTNFHSLQGKKPCKYFFSAEGCKYGDNCTFLHSLTPNMFDNAPNFGVSTTAPPIQQPTNGAVHAFSSHLPHENHFNQNGFVINMNEQQQQLNKTTNAYQYPHMVQYPSNNVAMSSATSHSHSGTSVNNISHVSNSSQVPHQPPPQQQQICQFFKKGECRFGDKCRNLHLKNKSKLDEQTKKKLKTIRCRFGVNCPFGHECYYFHEQSDFNDDTTKPPSPSTQQ